MAMTTRELAALIGKRGQVSVTVGNKSIQLRGHIEDVHQAYGQVRYTINIDEQTATIRVNADSFTFEGSK